MGSPHVAVKHCKLTGTESRCVTQRATLLKVLLLNFNPSITFLAAPDDKGGGLGRERFQDSRIRHPRHEPSRWRRDQRAACGWRLRADSDGGVPDGPQTQQALGRSPRPLDGAGSSGPVFVLCDSIAPSPESFSIRICIDAGNDTTSASIDRKATATPPLTSVPQ